jgi:hypothetical protein
MTRTLALASLLTVALTGTAAAEPAGVTDFTTLDRFGGQTGVGADMAMTILAGDSDIDGFVTRWDLWAEYQAPQGFGAYLHLPISRAFFSDSEDPLAQLFIDEANGSTYLGSLELGGSYAVPIGADVLHARLGLVLPTADDSFGGFLTNAVGMSARLTDFALISPDTTWVRASVSPMMRRGQFFARVDAGVDLAVHQGGDDDDPDAMTETPDPMVRLNLGAGFDVTPLIALMGELATIGTTGDVEMDEDRFLHTAAITAAYRAERVQPSISFSTILDDQGRGDGYTLAAGVRGNF